MLRHSVTSNNQKPLLLIDPKGRGVGGTGLHSLWRVVAIKERPEALVKDRSLFTTQKICPLGSLNPLKSGIFVTDVS